MDEQSETFVICNDGTMVGYVCIYDGTCVLAMIVWVMLVVYIYIYVLDIESATIPRWFW